eukprot:s905_g30.t1
MCPAAVVIPHTCLANANLADTTYFTDVQVARSYAEDFAELVQTLETSISGSTLNVNSVMSALQLAWRRLQHMDPADEEQVMIQQDLIGFFNSVPHSRICSALQLTLCRLQEHFGQPAEDLAFQVDHKTGTRSLRMFKRQRRFRGSNTKVLRIQHVTELTEFLLQSACFKVGLDTYCQIQGACMGSPLAPLCCYAVSGTRTTDAFSCAVPSFRQIGQAYFSDLISMVYPLNLNMCQGRNC